MIERKAKGDAPSIAAASQAAWAKSKYNLAESIEAVTAKSIAVTADLSLGTTAPKKKTVEAAESLAASAAVTAKSISPITAASDATARTSRTPEATSEGPTATPTSSLEMPSQYAPPKLKVQPAGSLAGSDMPEIVSKLEIKKPAKKAPLKPIKIVDIKRKGKRAPSRQKLVVITRPEKPEDEDSETSETSEKKKSAKVKPKGKAKGAPKGKAKGTPKGKVKRKGVKPPRRGPKVDRSGENGDSGGGVGARPLSRRRAVIVGIVIAVMIAMVCIIVVIAVLYGRPKSTKSPSSTGISSVSRAMSTTTSDIFTTASSPENTTT